MKNIRILALALVVAMGLFGFSTMAWGMEPLTESSIAVTAPTAGTTSKTAPTVENNGSHYTVEWAGWGELRANGDVAEVADEVVFEEGETYYLIATLKADTGYFWKQVYDEQKVEVSGGTFVKVNDIYNYAAETEADSYSGMTVVVSVVAKAAGSSVAGDQIQVWVGNADKGGTMADAGGKVSVKYMPSQEGIEWAEAKDGTDYKYGDVVAFIVGDEITVTAKPDSGYIFKGWYHANLDYDMSGKDGSKAYKGSPISTATSYSYKPVETVVAGDSEALRYICAVFEKASGSSASDPTSDPEPQPKIGWVRVAGDDQYDTSAVVSWTGWETADAVVLATGENFPDALAAAGVAGIEGAPVVITKTSTGELSGQAASELARLRPKRILAIGGVYAMPQAVVDAACEAAGGASFVRLAGNRASDTAADMNAAYKGRWTGNTAFLATSLNYPDALSAAPLAYKLGMPIYLVDDWDTVSRATYDSMGEAGVEQVVVLGGMYCVSDAAKADLAAHGIRVAETLAGSSQYDTSLAIARWGLAHGMGADHMAVACGLNYPDALTGAALCGLEGSVMVLADSKDGETCLPVAAENKDGISFGFVFGGKFAVPYAVQNAFEEASGCPITPEP